MEYEKMSKAELMAEAIKRWKVAPSGWTKSAYVKRLRNSDQFADLWDRTAKPPKEGFVP